MFSFLLVATLSVFMYMTLFWLVAQWKQDLSIVDIAWGGGFVVITTSLLFLQDEYTFRQLLITTLVTLWGVRLMNYLYRRNRGAGEDYRYTAMRKRWLAKGKSVALTSYIRVYLLQGVVMLLIAYPLVAVHAWDDGSSFGILDGIGLLLWIIGFLFEVIGDYQLEKFKEKKHNKGKVMMSGLWKYTRHPNYFGEATLWWGIYLIVCSVPYGWTTFFAPAILHFSLLKVSGVPPLEKKAMKKPAYRAYSKRTNRFIPWFPKQETKGDSSNSLHQ
ncbi:DUF1295 domain-containing protein [Mechercharimyces sp. CAU 1602]|uniref:DUF1295 domain-containing protein n=1 Tax=Mechercharimyces sp. CAU 1602 TaxID=2973933 RepID=UPI00216334CD|nr:DUF1295 domain-containing protein [Mechercharimyces sp. CAU 1602]MCS1351325.1 DUF1295 domain-containing protein [Mechercharimyces sp. CAU 1602]